MNEEPIKYCAVCRTDKALFICGACRNIRYCSKSHQKQHWPVHKVNCSLNKSKLSGNSNNNNNSKEQDKKITNNSISVSNNHISNEVSSVKAVKGNDKDINLLVNEVSNLGLDKVKQNGKVNNNCKNGDIVTVTSSSSVAKSNSKPTVMYSTANSASSTLIPSSQSDGDADERRISTTSEPDFSTPIDLTEGSRLGSHAHPRPHTPSLFQLDLCPDTSGLADSGFNEKWFDNVINLVVDDLNKFGVCVIDQFLGKFKVFLKKRCYLILVKNMMFILEHLIAKKTFQYSYLKFFLSLCDIYTLKWEYRFAKAT